MEQVKLNAKRFITEIDACTHFKAKIDENLL